MPVASRLLPHWVGVAAKAPAVVALPAVVAIVAVAALPVMLMPAVPEVRFAGLSIVRPEPLPPRLVAVRRPLTVWLPVTVWVPVSTLAVVGVSSYRRIAH